jgi:PIN domain nuclease of toxin-antitoxin system
MGIKVAIGRLPLPEPVGEYVSTRMTQLGARSLNITSAHAVQALMLPLHHCDPFDRMLIAQTQLENMRLVSADSMLQQYDVALL